MEEELYYSSSFGSREYPKPGLVLVKTLKLQSIRLSKKFLEFCFGFPISLCHNLLENIEAHTMSVFMRRIESMRSLLRNKASSTLLHRKIVFSLSNLRLDR